MKAVSVAAGSMLDGSRRGYSPATPNAAAPAIVAAEEAQAFHQARFARKRRVPISPATASSGNTASTGQRPMFA